MAAAGNEDAAHTEPTGRFEVTVEPAGYTFSAAAGRPLLNSAEDAGIVLPSSCRNGTCRTCIAQLLAGHVTYDIEWPGVSREEKQEGWILPCVAHPLDCITLRAEAATRFDI